MAKAVALLRENDPVLAHDSTRQLEKILSSLAKTASQTGKDPDLLGKIRPDGLPATHTGHTLWFSKWTVALWATAGTAVVIAALVILGVPGLTAAGAVWALIRTFWAAVDMGECAWFTYSSPRSWGTYHC
jgi:hypothetical protein